MKTKLLLTLMILFGSLCIQNEYNKVNAAVPPVAWGVIFTWNGDVGTAIMSYPDDMLPIGAIVPNYVSYSISGNKITFTIYKSAWIAAGSPTTIQVNVLCNFGIHQVTLVPNDSILI